MSTPDGRQGRIRVLALALVTRGDDLLVFRGNGPATGKIFFRPLGGGVEFGEAGAEALRRAMLEELGAEIGDVRLRGVLENLFTWDARPWLEVVMLFDTTLRDPALYAWDDLVVLDTAEPVVWLPLADVREGRAVLYPDGLPALLVTGA